MHHISLKRFNALAAPALCQSMMKHDPVQMLSTVCKKISPWGFTLEHRVKITRTGWLKDGNNVYERNDLPFAGVFQKAGVFSWMFASSDIIWSMTDAVVFISPNASVTKQKGSNRNSWCCSSEYLRRRLFEFHECLLREGLLRMRYINSQNEWMSELITKSNY